MTYQPNCTLPKELLEQIAADGWLLERVPVMMAVAAEDDAVLVFNNHPDDEYQAIYHPGDLRVGTRNVMNDVKIDPCIGV